jgi:hypothetical protein
LTSVRKKGGRRRGTGGPERTPGVGVVGRTKPSFFARRSEYSAISRFACSSRCFCVCTLTASSDALCPSPFFRNVWCPGKEHVCV